MKDKNRREKPVIEMLFQLYKKDMFRMAYSILKDAGKAEDAVQNTFLKLLKNRKSLRFEPDTLKAKSYCVIAAKATALDMYRKEKRMQEEPISDNLLLAEDSLDLYLQRESLDCLHSKIDLLKDIYKTALVLRHFQELSFREIGEATGVSEATARKRYQLARKQLEEMIRKEGDCFE